MKKQDFIRMYSELEPDESMRQRIERKVLSMDRKKAAEKRVYFKRTADKAHEINAGNNTGIEYAFNKTGRSWVKKKIIIPLIAIITVIGGSTTALAYIYNDETIRSENGNQEYEWAEPKYEINSKGQTYGSIFNIQFEGDYPDLILVEGEHGVTGYLKKEEYIEQPPASPEEAVKKMKELNEKSKEPKRLNVYDKDGVTVIDTFLCVSE